mmetsp:Transcript_26024/g.61169  ORF Transcript_26024/g.61169 Transcript_26024/m.61169 type:complete len:170 (+) Transcript_26024:103-612(+)|eukprot:CAMPEP_0172403534 /NCGR_PEP_ID=MMETSP1061-20121228/59666_1 /TAXON_ID=37318 /ORGANISM="Pseudo-nitzschia pungens, Strain cf. pungens" /LENGTH=169 /DNA_ID=CAMNT_0013137979 /DNA_START=96 /DNA_END=605 /DNA_ORIENTATION=-
MVKEFQLKQKFKLVSDDYKITLNGVNVFKVKGSPMKLGSQASLQKMDGTELGYLKQTKKTILVPWNSYEWFKDGTLFATVKQGDWGMMSKKEINIDIPGENDYKIKGDRMSWRFTIHYGQDEVKVAEIFKKWGILDSYVIRVEDDADEVDILMCAILIDATYHDNDDHR